MHIIVADKDPDIVEIVSTRMTNRNFDVTGISESAEVLRAMERGSVDVILISSEMERIGGRYLIEKIREKQHLASVPVILMTHENQIAELLMGQDRGFDDFLIKPFNPLVLQLRISLNIGRARIRSEANALTHLPGNTAIEKVIRQKIDQKEKFSVLYIDINNFKSFNDRYSFEKGDAVIKQTAKILMQTKDQISSGRDCFVGHIGGDDFIVVTSADREETFARAFIAEFDRIMPTYYGETDRKRGMIRVKNRRGKLENFPLMSCSVAGCNNLYREYKSVGEIAQDAAEVKSFLKSQPGSHYLSDRRSSPIEHLDKAIEILSPDMIGRQRTGDRVDPLGRVLLNTGLITEEELDAAIKKHLETGQRLGQTLIGMNLVRSQDVGKLLEKKLGVPYVSLKSVQIPRDLLRLFTSDFMKSHRVVPVEAQGEKLMLAMCDPFDIRTLDAIESISQLKPIPCLALEDEFEEFIDQCSKEDALKEKTG
ncbi:MAG: response regulator [Candidatus Omnitrophica bacterium]|nr:response regulator [Candidatus Omnitrophota bacterium]